MKTIETEWVVITGAPSSGKTSVIRELQAMGQSVMQEAASICIQTRLDGGEQLDDICRPEAQVRLQYEILNKNMEFKLLLDPEQRHFFDRCAIDTISYCKLYGMSEDDFRKEASKYRFKKVFHMERLQFEANDVRIENDDSAAALGQYLQEVYTSLGYDVIRVPIMSIRERVDFILQSID